MSIDDYMNRARNEDCFYALSPISDEYVALDKFYLMLEASIREKYGDFDKMSKGEKRRFLRQNAADEDIPY